jgi:GNAT superfamily N-acetyltransferase
MTAFDGGKDAAGVKLLPAITGTLLGRFRIRRGTADDVTACDRIARQQEKAQPSSLGWVMKQSYTAKNHTFHVGEVDGIIRGFVLFSTPTRGKNKSWHVVHALAVQPGWEGWGIGRNLLYSVPTPIRLKCPQTVGKTPRTNPANAFYRNAGMQLAGTEAGNKRALNVWELKVLPILVQGTNKLIPNVARRSGFAYGTREVETPQDWVYQVDIDLADAEADWRRYRWGVYMRKIRQWRPFAALVVDYFEPAQKDTMLRQVQDLRDAGVLRILVCPKFDGAVQDIPSDCIVAISVPSSYSGFVPPLGELEGRRVHLLGGSPVQWFGQKSRKRNRPATGYVAKLQGAGAIVVSVDGNSHFKIAQTGNFHANGRSVKDRRTLGLYDLAVLSGRNIVRELNAAADSAQLPLWVA